MSYKKLSELCVPWNGSTVSKNITFSGTTYFSKTPMVGSSGSYKPLLVTEKASKVEVGGEANLYLDELKKDYGECSIKLGKNTDKRLNADVVAKKGNIVLVKKGGLPVGFYAMRFYNGTKGNTYTRANDLTQITNPLLYNGVNAQYLVIRGYDIEYSGGNTVLKIYYLNTSGKATDRTILKLQLINDYNV